MPWSRLQPFTARRGTLLPSSTLFASVAPGSPRSPSDVVRMIDSESPKPESTMK